MPAKKSSKKPAAKSASKAPANKTPATKKSATNKAVANKPAPTAAVDSKAPKETPKAKKKASEFVKRPSHTPAVFKPSKRPAHILFTIDDVRELLKKKAKEEKLEAEINQEASKPPQVAASTPPPSPVEIHAPQNNRHEAASLDDILGLSGGFFGGTIQKEIPAKFRKYYDLLIDLRHEVSAELNMHSKETLKRSQKEDTGDISISMDAGTDNFERDFALSLLSSEQDALKEIDSAIQRIHKGTYGVCEETGEPISADRLEAVPFTRFSLEGQRQHEATHRRRSDRGGTFLSDGSGDSISFGDDDGDN